VATAAVTKVDVSSGHVGAQRTKDSRARSAPRSLQPKSSAFASKSKRFAGWERSAADLPPPGEYDVRPQWGKGARGLISSGGERFRAPKDRVAAPGPGQYYDGVARLTASTSKTGRSRANVFLSASARFQRSRTERERQALPGPGSYDPDFLYGNLNKPTFNVSIAEDSAL